MGLNIVVKICPGKFKDLHLILIYQKVKSFTRANDPWDRSQISIKLTT